MFHTDELQIVSKEKETQLLQMQSKYVHEYACMCACVLASTSVRYEITLSNDYTDKLQMFKKMSHAKDTQLNDIQGE